MIKMYRKNTGDKHSIRSAFATVLWWFKKGVNDLRSYKFKPKKTINKIKFYSKNLFANTRKSIINFDFKKTKKQLLDPKLTKWYPAIGFASIVLLFAIIQLFSHNQLEKNIKIKKNLVGFWAYSAQINQQIKAHFDHDSKNAQIKIERDQSSIQFSIPIEKSTIETRDNQIIYTNSQNDEKIIYQALDNGIKEEIILYNKPQSNIINSEINLTNLVVSQVNSLLVFFDKKQNYQFHFVKPFIEDSNGNRSYNIKFKLKESDEKNYTPPDRLKPITKELLAPQIPDFKSNKKYTLQIEIDQSWLDREDIVYPIIVDPTIVHDTSGEFSGSFDRASDTGSGSAPAIESYYQELPLDQHTTALWHINEAADDSCSGGEDLCEESGNYHLTDASSTITTGQLENARIYNGTSSCSTIASQPSTSINNWTIEAWVYPTTINQSNKIIVYNGNDAGGYGLSINGTDGSLYALYGSVAWIDSGYNLPVANQWYHLALSRNLTHTYFYVNGELVSDTSTSTPVVPNARFSIGCQYSGTTAQRFFAGYIDEVRVSDVARTPEEIKAAAQRRPDSIYTSPVIDIEHEYYEFNSLSWSAAGIPTGDGETATTSATANLVAQWNFNETSGTAANNDAEGTSCGGTPANCDGTLTNFATTTSQDAAVMSGWTASNRHSGAGGLMFDGSNDIITVNNSSLDLSTNFTMETWIKVLNKDQEHQPISWGVTTTGQRRAMWIADTTGYLGFAASSSNVASTTNVADGNWHHAVITVDSAGLVKIYADSILVASGSPTLNSYTYAGTTIGCRSSASMCSNVVLDTTRIYNKALTVQEIISNYNSSRIQFQTRTSADSATWEAWRPTTSETAVDNMDNPLDWKKPSSSIFTNSMIATASSSIIKAQGNASLQINAGQLETSANTVGLWHFDETNGDNAGNDIFDSSTAANNGEFTGTGIATTIADGISGKVRKFNGTDDYVTIADGSDYSLSTYTISAWINRTSDSGAIEYIFDNRDAVNDGISMYVSAADLFTCLHNADGVAAATTALKTGVWYHVACVENGTTLVAYVNGKVETTDAAASSATSESTNATIGTLSHTTPANFFSGYIDEVMINNAALTATEIAENYRMSSNHYLNKTVASTDLSDDDHLIFSIAADQPGTYLQATIGESAFANYQSDANTLGLWSLEEISGTGAYLIDSSGTGNHGTPVNSPIFVEGKIGKARRFNGSSQYINTGTGINIANSSFTLDVWAKRAVAGGSHFLFGQGSGSTNIGLHFGFRNTNVFTCSFFNNDLNTTIAYTDTDWHHWACTYDATTNDRRIYRDGVLVAQNTASADYQGTGQFNIGIIYSSPTNYFQGIIDQARVSNIVRTPTEIRQTYEIGRNFHPITIDFRASLDSGNLITSTSDTSFTIDSTSYGFPAKGSNLYEGDKIIVSENFDGTDYIAQGTVLSINSSTGAVTVLAWDAGSTVPSGGFTVNATVFKWQKYYFDLSSINAWDRDAINNLTLRLTNGYQGRTIWLDDIMSNAGYLTNNLFSSITSSPHRYVQYRAIQTSSDHVSTQLNSVVLDYTLNLPPDQVTFQAAYLHNNLETNDTTPEIRFSTIDNESEDLEYQVQWYTDADFGAASNATSGASAGFANITTPADTSPFNSGNIISYTFQTPLANNTTYFYRVRAKDTNGQLGEWSEIRSVTIKTSLHANAWLQTHADQFSQNTTISGTIVVDDINNLVKSSSLLYRPITITNASSTLTDYDVLVQLDTAALITAGKMQSDCDDIRFYSDEGHATNLNYWIESGCNTTTTQIWVRLSSIPNGDTIIYLEYNNPVAVSNSQAWTGTTIAAFESSCPAGWTSFSALNTNNRYPRGNTTAGGYVDTHSHTYSFSTGGPSGTDSYKWVDTTPNVASSTHTHLLAGTTVAGSVNPPYKEVIYCSLDTNTYLPNTFTTAYLGIFATTPTSWTRDAGYDSLFLRGNASAGGTGGGSGHTHTYSGTSGVPAGTTQSGAGAYNKASVNHTHTYSGTSGSDATLPVYEDFILANPNSTATLPEGGLLMLGTDTIPPYGYESYTSLNNNHRYVRGNSTAGGTGGTATHTHTMSGTTDNRNTSVGLLDEASSVSGDSHTHNYSNNTATGTTDPPYYDVVFIQRKTDSTTNSVGSEIFDPVVSVVRSQSLTAAYINPNSASWGQLVFTDDETYGDIKYKIYYDNSGTPTIIPDSVLAGNSTGFDTSPVDLHSISTTTYPVIYLVAEFTNNTGVPKLNDWEVKLNTPPTAPTNLETEAQTNPSYITDVTPEFSAIYNDPDTGDYANYYQIEVNTHSDFTGIVMWDSTKTSMTNLAAGSRSGLVSYAGEQLESYITYYWRIRFWDIEGEDGSWNTESAYFTTPPIKTPAYCTIDEVTDDSQLTINWTNDSTSEDNYIIEKNTNGAGWSAFQTKAANSTTHLDTGVSQTNNYAYRIKAIDGDFSSPWCTTDILDLQSGNFNFEGLNMEGLNID